MAGKARRYVAELSDGERQKAMIAKVLVQECPLILLDEPTAFLDVESRMEVMRLLRKLALEEHKAVLLSTHDVDQALAMSDRLWLMTQEREMLCGTTEDLVLSGAMDRLFGSTAIRFDAVRGIYAPENRNSRVVRLEAADEALRYWAQNLLVRHGFRPVASDEGGGGGEPCSHRSAGHGMDTKRNLLPLLFVCRTGRNVGGPEVVFYSGTLFVSGRIRFQIASFLFSGGFILRGTAWDSPQYPFDVQDFFPYQVSFLHGVRIRHGNLGSDAFPVDDDVRPTATTGGGDTQPEPPEGRRE